MAKDIAKVLGATSARDGYMEGNGYQVTWTFGHLCELKEPHEYQDSWKPWALGQLPMIPARYGIRLKSDKGVEHQFQIIRGLMQNAECIINCGDAGQEGELIQRWVMQMAGARCPVKRLWISSLTEEAIREGFDRLKDQSEYQSLYEAGLMRAIGDWTLGMNATRLYTLKYRAAQGSAGAAGVLSIGRVQTPTLALIVKRQQEIENFVPRQSWVLSTMYRDVKFAGICHDEDAEAEDAAQVAEAARAGKTLRPKAPIYKALEFATEAEGNAVLDSIKDKPLSIISIDKKKGTETPPRLYDLTSLQVDCNRKFGFSADQTLQIIQGLYEKKVTTYPRVDTTFLPDDVYPKCGQIMNGLYKTVWSGIPPYAELVRPLSGKPLKKSKKVFDNSKVTDHHAIIPTGVPPQGLTEMEQKVFDLIARTFVAAFYDDCKFETTTVMARVEDVMFRTSGRVIVEEGWRAVFRKEREEDRASGTDAAAGSAQASLPAFVRGEEGPHAPLLTEKWTTPPKPYTEATLLRAMETAGKMVEDEELRDALKANGIGRPSTRAAIIETLFRRRYIRKERTSLWATATGVELIGIIHEELLKSAELTGIWECKLRQIESRQYDARQFLDELKQMVTDLVMTVMRDNSNRHVSITEEVERKGRKPARSAAGRMGVLAVVLGCLLTLVGCKPEQYVKKGDAFYAIGEYTNAAAQYKIAYSRTPPKEKKHRGERAWKLAESYGRIGYVAKAAGAYQNAIRYKYPDSTAYLKLARMQHSLGNYKEAQKNYAAYLEYDRHNILAQNGITGCRLAPLWKKEPTLYTVKKQPVLSSRRSDYSPALYGDEWDQLYFTTTRQTTSGKDLSGITGTKMADIFYAKKDDKGKWSQPEAVEGELNSAYDEGACAFSPDGSTMYFTRCTSDPDYPRRAQIMTSKRSDATWSKPEEFVIAEDTLTTFAHPAVSPDGKWLYFTCDMPGGMGGMDIWRISLDENNIAAMENLGEPVNTPGDEVFPTFRPNGDLYFSSNGHPGMGGLDIFCARQNDRGKWKIENLRSPVNSQGDDFGMTFEGLHNRGYFATNRANGRGWDQIMSFECPEIIQTVKGWVYEKDGYELSEGLVYMVGNDGTNTRLTVRSDGSFEQELKPGVDYIFMATCKGFLNHTEELSIDQSEESRQYTLQFPLSSLTSPVLIRNVFYAFDSAELTDNSTQALDSLVTLLNENPHVTIELSAHCDYRGADTYNLRLSQRRAESVVRYLISQGITQDRLTPVGYGESNPKTVTRRLAAQYPFLKEGDVLTEQYILSLPDAEQQEVCNSLNRRTEFRVLRTTYGM